MQIDFQNNQISKFPEVYMQYIYSWSYNFIYNVEALDYPSFFSTSVTHTSVDLSNNKITGKYNKIFILILISIYILF